MREKVLAKIENEAERTCEIPSKEFLSQVIQCSCIICCKMDFILVNNFKRNV
jgi:hypothetical protein